MPSDLREKLGRDQIVETLRTRDVSEAMSRRTERAAHWEAVFSQLRGTLRPDASRPPREIYQDTIKYLRNANVEVETANANRSPGDEQVTEYDVLQDRLLVEAGDQHGLDEDGRPLAMSSVQQAKWDALQDYRLERRGKPLQAEGRYGLMITEARDRYLARASLDGDEQTIRQHRTTLSRLAEFLSDKPLQAVTKADVGRFMGVLETLDPKWGKSPSDSERSFEEIRRRYSGTGRQLSDATLNRHLGAVRSLWRWASAAGEVSGQCPTEGLERKVSKKTAKDRTYAAFDLDEIRKLFDGRLPQSHEVVETSMVALYSGMRLGEICALRWEDIRDQDGVTVFNIDNAKSIAGIRRVPVHEQLAWLLDRRTATGPVWPSLARRGPEGGSQAITKAFGHFKRTKGFVGRKKVFHSFRKTFITLLARTGAQEAQIAQIVGHEHNQITFSVYNPEGFPLKLCKDVVDQFRIPDFDPAEVVERSQYRSG